MPVIQVNTDNTRIRLFEQNEKTSYDAMNAISGAVANDSGYDHLINLALAMAGEFSTTPKLFGFKTTITGAAQVTIDKGIAVRSDGIFKFSGGVYGINGAAQSGIFEIELSTLYDSPVSKDYINILTETISTAVGNSRKNFQLKLYENYTNSLTPPSPTAGRYKLFEYVMNVPSGSIVTLRNSVTNSGTTGKVPLGSVVYTFSPFYSPSSGVVDSDGFMLADGATVPNGNALSGWVTPNLVDGSYLEGALVPNVAGLGSNNKTLSVAEMPLHSHTMAGSGSPINVVTDIMMAGGVTSPGYVAASLQSGATNTIKQDLGLALYQLKQNVTVSISGNTGNAGSGTAFDMRTKRKQGIPLIRVN